MTQPPSPLASPPPWDSVSAGYVAEVVPVFTPFSEDAVRLAGVRAGQEILDVACGPGTLSFVAAKAGARVHAIDFAPRMIEALRARAATEGIAIDARVGDGQALPFDDARFDAAFSMFGLMFFPDRVQGMRELRRVVRHGAPVVLGSWQPFERVPLMAEVFAAVAAAIPGCPFGATKAPLGDELTIRSEMTEAGLRDIEVHEAVHGWDVESPMAFWDLSIRTNVGVIVLKDRLGARWPELDAQIRDRLRARFGDGPQHVPMVANLAMARK